MAVLAEGVGAESFSGYYDNTQIYEKMADLLTSPDGPITLNPFNFLLFSTAGPLLALSSGAGCAAVPVHGIEVFSMRIYHVSPLWIVIPDAVLTALLLIG